MYTIPSKKYNTHNSTTIIEHALSMYYINICWLLKGKGKCKYTYYITLCVKMGQPYQIFGIYTYLIWHVNIVLLLHEEEFKIFNYTYMWPHGNAFGKVSV
jgi:hypothetical protein